MKRLLVQGAPLALLKTSRAIFELTMFSNVILNITLHACLLHNFYTKVIYVMSGISSFSWLCIYHQIIQTRAKTHWANFFISEISTKIPAIKVITNRTLIRHSLVPRRVFVMSWQILWQRNWQWYRKYLVLRKPSLLRNISIFVYIRYISKANILNKWPKYI